MLPVHVQHTEWIVIIVIIIMIIIVTVLEGQFEQSGLTLSPST